MAANGNITRAQVVMQQDLEVIKEALECYKQLQDDSYDWLDSAAREEALATRDGITQTQRRLGFPTD